MSLLNPEKYRCHAEGLGLSETQVDEVIHIVASIMESFVDAALGVHPVQIASREAALQRSGTQSEHAKLTPEFQEQQSTLSAGPIGGEE